MSIIRAKNFKGYSSKPDDLIDHPEIAEYCDNVIINRGDICNIPFPIDRIGWEGRHLVDFLESASYISQGLVQEKTWWLIYLDSGGDVYFLEESDLINDLQGIRHEALLALLPSHYWFKNENTLNGNFFQFGDWIYLFTDAKMHGNRNVFGRMVRFRPRKLAQGIIVKTEYLPVGLRAPYKVEYLSKAGNAFTGNYDFAVSFVTNIDSILHTKIADQSQLVPVDDIESNAVLLDDEKTYANGTGQPTLKVYLQPGMTSLEPANNDVNYQLLVAVYAKESGMKFYEFCGFYNLTGDLTEEDGLYYKTVTVTNATTRSSKIVDEITHECPKAGIHVAFFKGRIYSSRLQDIYINAASPVDDRYSYIKHNTLQVSPSFNDEYYNSGYEVTKPDKAQQAAYKIINYIDETLTQPIGSDKEGITGLIEFLGQLIIFKKTQTHVLTDDIKLGEIRLLFNDLGCVNVDGGKGYIVVADVLYFVAVDGVYAYTGEERPIKISGQIDEDLKLIAWDDYKDVRLSQDNRYGLLYVTFPNLAITYIFHVNEGGVWTQIYGHIIFDIITDPEENVYYNRHFGLYKLGKLEDEDTVLDHPEQIAKWQVGILTLQDDTRIKKWKEFTLETQTELDEKDKYIKVRFTCISDEEETIVSRSCTKCMHLGLWAKGIRILIEFSSYFKTHPFRINGYSLTADFRGRR